MFERFEKVFGGSNFYSLHTIESTMNYLALVAEFFGTFLLLLSILATGNPLVIGLTLTLVIYLIGDLSGGHINPAVSVTMFMNNALSLSELVSYAVVQCLGGVSALFVYKAIV